MTITFFDIPSATPENGWSPNTWKARYALNFKGIPYKTEWIEYPDIEAHCKKLGILPTSKNPDGSPHYTLPAIHDPSTGIYVSDSMLIAEYLEKTYPDTPSLFPHNTVGLQSTFFPAFESNLDALWQFSLPATCSILNAPSAEYFRRTREAHFGKTMEDLFPKGEVGVVEWAKVQEGYTKTASWFAKTGPFMMGDTPSWADFVVASYTLWSRIIWGEDSQQWKDITSWNGGRWKTLMESLKKYETVA
jgi:glutathione S-transferase